jgi:hypothetical protein
LCSARPARATALFPCRCCSPRQRCEQRAVQVLLKRMPRQPCGAHNTGAEHHLHLLRAHAPGSSRSNRERTWFCRAGHQAARPQYGASCPACRDPSDCGRSNRPLFLPERWRCPASHGATRSDRLAPIIQARPDGDVASRQRPGTLAVCASRSCRCRSPLLEGSIPQGMPLLRTQTIPVSTLRFDKRGRPPLGVGGFAGKSGAPTAHRSSDKSGLLIPHAYHSPGLVRRFQPDTQLVGGERKKASALFRVWPVAGKGTWATGRIALPTVFDGDDRSCYRQPAWCRAAPSCARSGLPPAR